MLRDTIKEHKFSKNNLLQLIIVLLSTDDNCIHILRKGSKYLVNLYLKVISQKTKN